MGLNETRDRIGPPNHSSEHEMEGCQEFPRNSSSLATPDVNPRGSATTASPPLDRPNLDRSPSDGVPLHTHDDNVVFHGHMRHRHPDEPRSISPNYDSFETPNRGILSQ